MKREYVAPSMRVEVFEASESIAACYKIYCNVRGSGMLWSENGKKAGLQTMGRNKDDQLTFSNLNACNKWHKGVIRSEEPKANGYWKSGRTVTPVFWWKENLGSYSDYHATTLDKINWETNPNAS